MIRLMQGDILADNAEAIVNGVNCSGIADNQLFLKLKHLYPEMFNDYCDFCNRKSLYVGRLHIWENKEKINGFKYVINIPTRNNWREKVVVSSIFIGIEAIKLAMEVENIKTIAIPALGCANNSIAWNQLEILFFQEFADNPDYEVRVYPHVEV